MCVLVITYQMDAGTIVVCDFLISYAVSPALLSLPSPSFEEKWRLSDDFVAFL